jgi:hypothetical protein
VAGFKVLGLLTMLKSFETLVGYCVSLRALESLKALIYGSSAKIPPRVVDFALVTGSYITEL